MNHFNVESVTRISVRGPGQFNRTVNSEEEGRELAELLNDTYAHAFKAGQNNRGSKGTVVPEWTHYCRMGHEAIASLGDHCPICEPGGDAK